MATDEKRMRRVVETGWFAAALLLLGLVASPPCTHAQESTPTGQEAGQGAGPVAVIAHNGVATSRRLRGVFLEGGQLYLRLSDLGTYLSSQDRFDIKNKYIMQVGDRELKFTLGSSAVILDNGQAPAVNLPAPVQLHRGVLYAPADGVAAVLTAFTGRPCEWLPDREWLNYTGTGFNVVGIEINSIPEQGTSVTILTTEPLLYETFSQGEGVLNVTLQGARADLAALRNIPRRGLINRVQVIEQRDDILQITFYFSRRFQSAPEILRAPNGLIFVLRNAAAGEAIDPGRVVEPPRAQRIKTVIIDPGHGGKDPGSLGATDLQEKDVALDIALRLKERFEKDPATSDIKVVMTRETDVYIPLPRRYQIANEAHGDLFISIHANAAHDRSANGFMTFFLADAKNDEARQIAALENSVVELDQSNSALQIAGGDILKGILGELVSTKYLEESQQLAGIIQDEMTSRIRTQVRPRRVDQAGFLVLNGAYMPSVLVEVAFISNRAEESFLRQNSFKNKVAEALHAAVKTYRERVEISR
jgi:N-acetylmuramoyl-L-alanine amidase